MEAAKRRGRNGARDVPHTQPIRLTERATTGRRFDRVIMVRRRSTTSGVDDEYLSEKQLTPYPLPTKDGCWHHRARPRLDANAVEDPQALLAARQSAPCRRSRCRSINRQIQVAFFALSAGTSIRCRRWPDECGLSEVMMTDNRVSNGKFGAILGGVIVAVALAFFLFVGGVGKKAVNSDSDLPPIAKGEQR